MAFSRIMGIGLAAAISAGTAHADQWTGFYGGLFTGAFDGISSYEQFGLNFGENSFVGHIVGLTAGYDHQFGTVVVGASVDVAIGDARHELPTCLNGCFTELNHFYTAQARVGYDTIVGLAYVTAGFAQMEVFDRVNGAAFEQTTVVDGTLVGVGFETMVSERGSLQLELSSFDFDSYITPVNVTTRPEDIFTLTIGYNWRF